MCSHLLGKNLIERKFLHLHHTFGNVDSYCLWRYSCSVAPCCAPLVRTRMTGHQIVEVTSRSSLAVYFHLFCNLSLTKFCLSCLHTFMFLWRLRDAWVWPGPNASTMHFQRIRLKAQYSREMDLQRIASVSQRGRRIEDVFVPICARACDPLYLAFSSFFYRCIIVLLELWPPSITLTRFEWLSWLTTANTSHSCFNIRLWCVDPNHWMQSDLHAEMLWRIICSQLLVCDLRLSSEVAGILERQEIWSCAL